MNFSHKLWYAAGCFILLFSAFGYGVRQSGSAGVFRFYLLSLINFEGWLMTSTYLFCLFLSLSVYGCRNGLMFCCGILAELLPVLPEKLRFWEGVCKESGRRVQGSIFLFTAIYRYLFS